MKSRAVQFRHYSLMLVDADEGYEWGKETPYGTDCSGTVCFPLIRMGYKIRTTADELYNRLFTFEIEEKDELDLERVVAVFYVMQKPWTKLSGERMAAGTVRHVTPVVGRYVVVDADWDRDQIILKTAKEVRVGMERKGAAAEWREIDWKTARLLSGKIFYGPDDEILKWLEGVK